MPTTKNPPSSDEDSLTTEMKKILVVEDDRELCETIRYTLVAAGFEVALAYDGNVGSAHAETKSLDLIVLDLMMPARSGFLLLERLRQFTESPIPVVVITGNEGARHREYAEMLGVDDYIQKPFTMDRLVNSINQLVGNE